MPPSGFGSDCNPLREFFNAACRAEAWRRRMATWHYFYDVSDTSLMPSRRSVRSYRDQIRRLSHDLTVSGHRPRFCALVISPKKLSCELNHEIHLLSLPTFALL